MVLEMDSQNLLQIISTSATPLILAYLAFVARNLERRLTNLENIMFAGTERCRKEPDTLELLKERVGNTRIG